MRRAIVFGFLFIAIPVVFAKYGQSGATFLALGAGARPLSLGGAYAALADGIDAIYWNPAGLANVNAPVAAFSHAQLFVDNSAENIGVAIPMPGGTFGVSAIGYLSGEIPKTTVSDQEAEVSGTYSANEYAIGFSYARKMTEKFAAGLSVKAVNQSIDVVSAFGVAVDAGATYNTGLRNLRFGFVIQNFGPDISYSGDAFEFKDQADTLQADDVSSTYISEFYPLPVSFQGGFAIDLVSSSANRLTLCAELVNQIDQPESHAVGLEYCFKESFFLRAGHTSRNGKGGVKFIKEGDEPARVQWERGIAGFSCGGGIKIPFSGRATFIDYSYEDHRYLNPVHRISLGLSL